MSQDRKIPELCSVEIHPFRCRPPLQPAWSRARPSERTFPPGTGTVWWFWWPRWSLWLTSASSCSPCPSLCPTRWGSAAGGHPFPGSMPTHLLSVTNRLQNHIWLAGWIMSSNQITLVYFVAAWSLSSVIWLSSLFLDTVCKVETWAKAPQCSSMQ